MLLWTMPQSKYTQKSEQCSKSSDYVLHMVEYISFMKQVKENVFLSLSEILIFDIADSG